MDSNAFFILPTLVAKVYVRLIHSNMNVHGASRRSIGAVLIAAGLAIQIAASWWPSAPVVTAMSTVALGATIVVAERLAAQRNACLVLSAHLLAYGGLYLLFVGSVIHMANIGSNRGWHLWLILDLIASMLPMALAIQCCVSAMTTAIRGEDATGR